MKYEMDDKVTVVIQYEGVCIEDLEYKLSEHFTEHQLSILSEKIINSMIADIAIEELSGYLQVTVAKENESKTL